MTAEALAASVPLLVAAAAGAAAGAAYFALLWHASRRLTAGGGAARFAGAAALRAGLLLGGLGALALAGAPAGVFVAAALGFLAARLAATRLAGPRGG